MEDVILNIAYGCAYLIMVVLLIFTSIKNKKSLQMLQQNLYNENNRYLHWINKNIKESFKSIEIYGLIFIIFLSITFGTYVYFYFVFLTIVLYVIALLMDRRAQKNDQNKKPLVVTSRIKRLMVTTFIIYLIPVVLGLIWRYSVGDFLLVLALMVLFNYYIIYLALLINTPMEKLIYRHFEKMAKQKLSSMPNLKVIGITGSYGKTSCKNILSEVLKEKYNTLATDKSINTFNGIMITINNKLTKFDECFIAEMGAYVKDEINNLCKLVNPQYGIITTIGTAHLETFGSEKNIQEGKMELIEYLPTKGVGVLNRDDPKQKEYKFKNKKHCKILWVGIDTEDDVDVKAMNIKCDNEGTSFDCRFKNDGKKYSFRTKLLGKHNVYNIISALALGREFGIEIPKLQQAVKKIKVVEHRLQLRDFKKFYQLDDAYNSNPVGAKAALDVLNMMAGKKVVVTPGMIELGEKEKYYNEEFGKQIAKVADMVILVGEKQTEPIMKGLKSSKYNSKNIKIINDVREAYSILNKMQSKEKIYALFENDLPDTYNEK